MMLSFPFGNEGYGGLIVTVPSEHSVGHVILNRCPPTSNSLATEGAVLKFPAIKASRTPRQPTLMRVLKKSHELSPVL